MFACWRMRGAFSFVAALIHQKPAQGKTFHFGSPLCSQWAVSRWQTCDLIPGTGFSPPRTDPDTMPVD